MIQTSPRPWRQTSEAAARTLGINDVLWGVVGADAGAGTPWAPRIHLDAPGPPAQGDWDPEIQVSRLVQEIPTLDCDRTREVSIHRGSIRGLPA